MEKKRLLIVGLEPQDLQAIKQGIGFNYLILHTDVLPKVQLIEGELFAESTTVPGKYLKINAVIFHGIFEDDFDFITLLALWNGPCLPNAMAMMDLRQRIPGLVKGAEGIRVSGYQAWNGYWPGRVFC